MVAAGRRRDLGREVNDVNGFHVLPKHVFGALERAHASAIAEGNVASGTGMICHEFKGGTGTNSRASRGRSAWCATAATRGMARAICFIASSANLEADQIHPVTLHALGNEQMDGLFLATAQAVEESIVNALVVARTMTGMNGAQVPAIDHTELQRMLAQHGTPRAAAVEARTRIRTRIGFGHGLGVSGCGSFHRGPLEALPGVDRGLTRSGRRVDCL